LRSLVVTTEIRLCSRSKLAKVEGARFCGYSEVYCVAVAAPPPPPPPGLDLGS
jgi:hypothetical protein